MRRDADLEPEQLPLFEGTLSMAALRDERERLIMAAAKCAANTRTCYASDWRSFAAWCARAGRVALPASMDTVALFLTHELARGLRVASVARKLTAVATRHRMADLAAPLGPEVRAVLTGARRERMERPRPKAALTIDQLREIERQLDGGGVRAARDRAILLFGFASAMRRSELVGLDLRDVEFVREGVRVVLRRSKTDQDGRGREMGIPCAAVDRALCPVEALERWVRARWRGAGPLFARVTAGGRVTGERLSGHAVGAVVKAAVTRIGLDARRFGAHSLRAGFVTAAGTSGAGTLEIMKRTGHRSVEMVERYFRPDLFAANPLARAL